MTFEDIAKVNEGLKTLKVKGKDYVEVNQRVLAFRKLYPNGTISTDIVSMENGVVVMQATVRDDKGLTLATGLAYEKENASMINKTSYIENCETSAVGRALGFIGIGIDTSIASAEEVTNAIQQQMAEGEIMYATPGEKEGLKILCKQKGMKLTDILKQVGFEAGDNNYLTQAQYGKAMNILNGVQ